MTVTHDLTKFGYRELKEAARLLTAYCETEPTYLTCEVQLAFNMNSGCVFLTDEDYNVAMMNGDDLEQWFSCPNCGHEGFKEDMAHGQGNPDCEEYMKDMQEQGLL